MARDARKRKVDLVRKASRLSRKRHRLREEGAFLLNGGDNGIGLLKSRSCPLE
jgi:hypothetical protein